GLPAGGRVSPQGDHGAAEERILELQSIVSTLPAIMRARLEDLTQCVPPSERLSERRPGALRRRLRFRPLDRAGDQWPSVKCHFRSAMCRAAMSAKARR